MSSIHALDVGAVARRAVGLALEHGDHVHVVDPKTRLRRVPALPELLLLLARQGVALLHRAVAGRRPLRVGVVVAEREVLRLLRAEVDLVGERAEDRVVHVVRTRAAVRELAARQEVVEEAHELLLAFPVATQTRAFDRVQPEGYDGVLHATLPAVALVAVVALRMVVFGASAQELVGDARGDDGGVFAFRPGAAAGVLRKGRRAHRRAGQQDQVRCLHVRFLFSLP